MLFFCIACLLISFFFFSLVCFHHATLLTLSSSDRQQQPSQFRALWTSKSVREALLDPLFVFLCVLGLAALFFPVCVTPLDCECLEQEKGNAMHSRYFLLERTLCVKWVKMVKRHKQPPCFTFHRNHIFNYCSQEWNTFILLSSKRHFILFPVSFLVCTNKAKHYFSSTQYKKRKCDGNCESEEDELIYSEPSQ